MSICWVRISWVSLPLLTILLLLCRASPGVALEPGKDYWFVETLAVSEVELPTGLVIRADDSAATPRGLLRIENQTETPLYVLSLNYLDVLVETTPDPDWKKRVGMAHEVATYRVEPDRPASLNTDALLDLDKHLVDRNVLSIAPPPENVTIPAAQASELLLVYDQQVLVVPFTLSYTLNPHFNNGSGANTQPTATIPATVQTNPTATPKEIAATQGTRNNMIEVGVAGVAILVVAGWLVWRGWLRR